MILLRESKAPKVPPSATLLWCKEWQRQAERQHSFETLIRTDLCALVSNAYAHKSNLRFITFD